MSNEENIKDTITVKDVCSTKARAELDAAKENFLSLITHELRTPLTGIVAITGLLEEAGPLTDKQKEYLSHLTECTDQLMNVLNDILDLTEMRAGKLLIRCSPFDLKSCVNGAINIISAKAENKGLSVSLRFGDGIPNMFMGDEMRLKQIFVNLLTNSVKFTDRGSITVSVDGEIDKEIDVNYNARTWRLWFSVRDTGIGIPLKDQENIFLMFEQCATNKKYSSSCGVGIGLSIVKNLVNLMGGEIKVESEGVPGKGSCFSFSIILSQQPDLTEMIKNNCSLLESARILVVDDREEIRMMLNNMLFKWGICPTTVGSAGEALQYLKHPQYNFSLAIVDINMPYMSGVELAQRISEIDPNLPLIALSSIGDIKEKNELFDFFLNKPIEEYRLFPYIIDCLKLNKNKPLNDFKYDTIRRRKRKKADCKIIVAEDDGHNSFMIKEMLINLGFSSKKIKIVEDGEKCVAEVKRKKYDVCLMDIRMPIMNGIDAAKHIRNMKKPPVIIGVSAGTTDECKNECQKAGMSAYITKPINKKELDGILKKLSYCL